MSRERLRVLRRRLAALAILTLALGGVPGAGAQTGQSSPPPTLARFAVQPSSPKGPVGRDWFIYTLSPGQVFGDIVAVSNLTKKPIRFYVYAKDASSVPNVGGFSAQKDDQQPVDVGSWIKLKTNRYTVKPGKRVDIPFSITIPDNAEPGDHAGAILATDLDSPQQRMTTPEGLSFIVRERVGARVYVRVKGPLSPGLRVNRLDVEYKKAAVPLVAGGGKATVTWTVENTGNVRLTPTAHVRVKGLFGRTVKELAPKELPELLPGGTYRSQDVLDGLPSIDWLSVEVNLTAENVSVTRTKRLPLHWSVFVLIALIVAAGIWWYLRRQHRKDRQAQPRSLPARQRRPVKA